MSDSSDRNIVIFVFVMTFLYINYLRIKIDIKNDWENMKCNPMNLWVSSFFKDSATANIDFNKCINSISTESIDKGLQRAYDKQVEAIQQISNQEGVLKSYLDSINNNINGPDGLIDQYKINEIKVDDIKEQHTTYKTINQLLASKDIDSNNLYDFTTKVKNIFDNIKNYLPSISY
jgi:hypothetical protein